MELTVESEIIDKKPILTADGLKQPQTPGNNFSATATSTSAATSTNDVCPSTLNSSLGIAVSGNSNSNSYNIHQNVPASNKNNLDIDIKPCIVTEGEVAGNCKGASISEGSEETKIKKEDFAVNIDIDVLPLIYDVVRW